MSRGRVFLSPGSAGNGVRSGFSMCCAFKLAVLLPPFPNSSLFVLQAAATCRYVHRALFRSDFFFFF